MLVDPLGICFDENGEMVLAALHVGVKAEDAKGSFGWPIRSRDIEVLPDPTDDELNIVRQEVDTRRSASTCFRKVRKAQPSCHCEP